MAFEIEKFIIVSEEESPFICRCWSCAPTTSSAIINWFDAIQLLFCCRWRWPWGSGTPLAIPQMILPELVEATPIYDMDTSVTYVAAWEKGNPQTPARPVIFKCIARTYPRRRKPSKQKTLGSISRTQRFLFYAPTVKIVCLSKRKRLPLNQFVFFDFINCPFRFSWPSASY